MEQLNILNKIVPDYAESFLSGKFKTDEMPLLESVFNYFSSLVDSNELSKVHLVACQHILIPQLNMFRMFVKLGIPAKQIYILPKVYSANDEVILNLKKLGCRIFEEAMTFLPKGNESFDDFHKKQCLNITNFIHQQISKNSKLIVLDDGGILLKSFAVNYKKFACQIFGVEQTASGKNILLKNKLPFIVTSVASSVEKIKIETNYIIRHSMERVLEYFEENKISKSVKIFVLGKGPIGKTTIKAFEKLNYDCKGYDILEKDKDYDLKEFDVIIGTTGTNSISIEDLTKLKKGVHLISLSSSDREFPAVHIRKNSKIGRKVHDTYCLGEGEVYLANGGFPITFKGNKIECLQIEMDVTMMKLFEGVILHTLYKAKIEASVNTLYFDKISKKYFGKILYTYALSITFLCLLNFFNPSIWYKPLSFAMIFLGCMPGLWSIFYFKKMESFVTQKM